MNYPEAAWVRVSPSSPCPVCGKTDYCGVSEDGAVCVCMRTESGHTTKNGGWLHRLTEVPMERRVAVRLPEWKPAKPLIDWSAAAKGFAKNLDAARRGELAAQLGLPADVLGSLPLIGWNPMESCWTFPEVDGTGRVVGLNRRFPDGTKKVAAGGSRGLSVPTGWRDRPGPVFVVEGASDVLALTACGRAAVGRPNNVGGVAELAVLLRDLPAGRVVLVVGENDQKPDGKWPGRDGAKRTAQDLSAKLRRDVPFVLPPAAVKDAREWVRDLVAGSGESIDWAAIGNEIMTTLAPDTDDEKVPAMDPIDPSRRLWNFTMEAGRGEKPVRRGRHMAAIRRDTDAMTGGWPRRVGGSLFCVGPGPEPRWLDTPEALFAAVAGVAGGGDTSPVEWGAGASLPSKAEFFEYLRQEATRYEAVESSPHEPPVEGHFYCHPPTTGGDGVALAGLLRRFCPATAVDAELIKAFVLTLIWGGPCGARPAFLFTAADDDSKAGRGIGKSTVCKVVAPLVGGTLDTQPGDDIATLKTRLLSAAGAGKRVVLIDNVKTHKLSWGDLEGLITADAISGRRLYAGEGGRANDITFVITVNGASLSKDMAQRCVVVKVARPAYSGTWERDARDYVRQHRWAILGDIVAALRKPAGRLGKASRWGAWEQEVLSRVADPIGCQQVIAERQDAVDEDDDDAARVREAFAQVIRDAGGDPEDGLFRFESSAVVEIVTRATGERKNATSASGHLKSIVVPEMKKGKPQRGIARWEWTGVGAVSGNWTVIRFEADERKFRVG